MSMEYPEVIIPAGSMTQDEIKNLCTWYLLERSYGHVLAMKERNLDYVHITVSARVSSDNGQVYKNYKFALVVEKSTENEGELLYQIEFHNIILKYVRTKMLIFKEPIQKPLEGVVKMFL